MQPLDTHYIQDPVISPRSLPAFASAETYPRWSAGRVEAPTFVGPGSLPVSSRIPMRHPTLIPSSDPGPQWTQGHTYPTFGPEEADRKIPSRSNAMPTSGSNRHPPRSTHDEFDGPHQFLPSTPITISKEQDLPHVQAHLLIQEQDNVLGKVNDRLSQCAFDFVAKYQFPIPLEQDKRPVQCPFDREWNEWVFLLKRMSSGVLSIRSGPLTGHQGLATKRRIPARVIYNGQIKQLVTILENSLEMRHAAKHQSRPSKDDRNVLQLISAGLQVGKILKDAACMEHMDVLYMETERLIQSRKASPGFSQTISGC